MKAEKTNKAGALPFHYGLGMEDSLWVSPFLLTDGPWWQVYLSSLTFQELRQAGQEKDRFPTALEDLFTFQSDGDSGPLGRRMTSSQGCRDSKRGYWSSMVLGGVTSMLCCPPLFSTCFLFPTMALGGQQDQMIHKPHPLRSAKTASTSPGLTVSTPVRSVKWGQAGHQLPCLCLAPCLATPIVSLHDIHNPGTKGKFTNVAWVWVSCLADFYYEMISFNLP